MNSKLPINVDDLLHGTFVEWERLEIKEGWNPLTTVQTLSAFANDFHNLGGGYVIIGVAEKQGQPVLPPTGLDAAEIDSEGCEGVWLLHPEGIEHCACAGCG